MKRTVVLELKNIICRSETDGNGSEPYLWVNLVQVLGAELQFYSVSPPRQDIAVSMKSGTSTRIPVSTGWWGANFQNDAMFDAMSGIVVLIALLEHDESPLAAIQKGRQAFDDEIRSKINIGTLLAIKGAQTAADRETIIGPIRESIKTKVASAIRSAQGLWDIFRDQDDSVGFGFLALEAPFKTVDAFSVRISSGRDIFDVEGEFRVNVVRPAICELERENINQAKNELGKLEGLLRLLQEKLLRASPSEKPSIIDQIEEVYGRLEIANANHVATVVALQRCIDMHVVESR